LDHWRSRIGYVGSAQELQHRLDERHQVHDSGQRVFITKEGEREVDGKS
jgi:hypothetical protein